MKTSVNDAPERFTIIKTISFTLLAQTSLSDLMECITNPNFLIVWFCDKISFHSFNSNYSILGNSIIGNWNNSIIKINKISNLVVEWDWELPEVGQSKVLFNLQERSNDICLKVKHSANFLFSPLNFAEDWLISLSNLKFWLEGEKHFPKLNYGDQNSNEILVSIFIQSDAQKIYSILTLQDKLNKLIANYAEVDIKRSKYNYGWIGDGPLNLLWHDYQKVIVHDWFHDTQPAGTIHWYISPDLINKSGEHCELSIKHGQLDLQSEFNKQHVIKSYRHGWIHMLQKAKMLAESGKISVFHTV